ncbi:MAG TPA: hypothetical protein VGM86_22065 [Thermoanaerobaculia bacterium]
MSWEIWALDPEAGEVILREGDLWFLSTMRQRWKPRELDPPQDILEWSFSRAVVPVGRVYGTRDEAVIVARQACRAAWKAGTTSPEEIGRLLDAIEAERERRHEEDPLAWARRFPDIVREAVELDRYFQAQGFAVEESLEWTCRTLQRLRESGDWNLADGELGLTLRRLAGAVRREVRGGPESSAVPKRQLSDYERKRLARDLDRLPTDDLEVLTCWADSSYGEEEIATLLQIPPGQVQRALSTVFGALRRIPEELRETDFAEICKQALRRRRV